MAGRTRWWLGVAAAAVAVLAAGCAAGADGGPDVAAEATTSTTTSTVPAPPAPTVEDEVLAAYQGYWDTWLAANDPPDPDHPDLERYATGAALEKVRQAISEHRSRGQAVALPDLSVSEHRASVHSWRGDMAVVRDCAVDDSQLVDVGTGVVLNGEVGTFLTEATLTQVQGRWKVLSADVLTTWAGAVECDV